MSTEEEKFPFLRHYGLAPWTVKIPILFIVFSLPFLFIGGGVELASEEYIHGVLHRLLAWFIAIGTLWFGLAVARAATNKLTVFNNRLQWHIGPWGQTQGSIALGEIATLSVAKTSIKNLPNVLIIRTKAGEEVRFGPIAKPGEAKAFIESLLPKPTPSPPPSL